MEMFLKTNVLTNTMRISSHETILKEVDSEIKLALTEGLLKHQRRLMSMISLGTANLVEYFLHKRRVINPGTNIKHNTFGLSLDNIKLKMRAVISKPINKIENLDEIIVLAHEIEQDRNIIVYGAESTEKILRRKIDLYLKLKVLCGYESS